MKVLLPMELMHRHYYLDLEFLSLQQKMHLLVLLDMILHRLILLVIRLILNYHCQYHRLHHLL